LGFIKHIKEGFIPFRYLHKQMVKPNYTQLVFFSFVSVSIITGIILLALTYTTHTNTDSSNSDDATTTFIPNSLPTAGPTPGSVTGSPGSRQFSPAECSESMFYVQEISEFQTTFSYSIDQTFYKKFINVGGIPIASSASPSDKSLFQAAKWTCNLISLAKPQVVQGLIQAYSKITVIGTNEQILQVPEYMQEDPLINELRAFGGSKDSPTTITAEENLMCSGQDPFISECKLLHQFGGHAMSMLSGNNTFLDELDSTYSSAMQKGLWGNTISSESEQEYFAEGVESWFDCNKQSLDSDHNGINTREKLKIYDVGLSRLLTDFYGDMPIRYSCPSL
jgi:hypothetical protein